MLVFVNKEIEKEHATWRVYFDGEGDSNQSEFERLSNHLKIAVIAPNEKLAAFYLRLLRCIVDEHVGRLELVLEQLEDDLQRPPNAEEIIVGFTESSDYMHSFSLQEKFTTTLQGYNHQTGKVEEEKVKADWNTVDVWTWPRLQKEWAEFESNYDW